MDIHDSNYDATVLQRQLSSIDNRLNGALRQHYSTQLLVFDAYLIPTFIPIGTSGLEHSNKSMKEKFIIDPLKVNHNEETVAWKHSVKVQKEIMYSMGHTLSYIYELVLFV